MSKRGAVGYLEKKENVKELRALILKYQEENKSKRKITYSDIYEYVKISYSKDEISFCPSLTWWKTKGKYLIKEANELKMKKVRFTKTKSLDIVDIDDLVNKYYDNKDLLIKYLSPYNEIMRRMAERVEKLESIIEKKEDDLNKLNDELIIKEDIIKKQINTINNLFYLHVRNEIYLKNLLQSEDGNSQLLRCALEETFEDPESYINEFTNQFIMNSEEKYDNILELKNVSNEEFEF